MKNLTNRPWFKYYNQIADLEIPELPLYSMFEQTVSDYGDHVAIIFEDEKITYRQLKDQVDRLAGAWREMGFEKGERLGLMLANHPDYVICYYAAQALGVTIVQINPMYTPRELLQIINDAKVSSIVGDPLAKTTIQEVNHLYSFNYIIGSQTETWGETEFKSIDELILFSAPLESPAKVNVHEDIAVIQYTGGTTGKMKGAMLTHYNLVANVIQSYSMYGDQMVKGEETVLTATPLYHVYAMTSAMNLGIYIGATLLLFRKFEVQDVLEKIKKYRPTFFPGVPRMYISFVNHPDIDKYNLDCLKTCSSGSAPLPVEVIKRFEKLTGAVIGEGFGLSEASPSTHRNPPFGIRKVGSIGIPMPKTDCMIIDNNGNELGPKCVGELLLRGPQIMKGYWANQEETASTLQNGWLHTGDLAMMDEDGYFYIVGRKKEMIIVGGFNIYPQEIEGVLYEYPDIKEAAVVGIPHEEHGELVKAYIVPKDGVEIDLEELKGYCYSKLTPYKVPKVIEVREKLPRNTVGKLLKRLLVKEELEKGEEHNAG
ncbi:long-chain fatty acid--CoA ligase [Mesobacillus campisalis]|uniref:Long-chain fatty acid--CoA ligase n=1 Tax=Mesobacillus campisalis TaxID=1408103 RepID=A0A0M2SU23_9BACI|nr:long-chain fatty acid--CoA ligase [Mesobacillus campisalis]KKK37206.1 long-chain fatty acid--CoA ligase [Mesobacillus campisalis]